MTANFLPDDWAKNLYSEMLAGMKRTDELLYGPQERRRKGHSESRYFTADELAQRKRAVRKWKRLTKRLLAENYLRHDSCYECGGELIPVNAVERHEWVWDESESEHAERLKDLPEWHPPQIVFQTRRLNIPKADGTV